MKRAAARGREAKSVPRWERPLWICPKCGNAFANPGNWHSCVRVPLAAHFKNKPKAAALFKEYRKVLAEIGRVRIVSSKTRIVFMVRVRFAGCTVRKDSLRAALWLPYPVDSPKIIRKEFIPPYYHLLSFDIRERADFDAEFRRLLREAYDLGGLQHHLKERARLDGHERSAR